MPQFSTEQFVINGLEVECWIPENYQHAAIVCHPHSLHGGTMNNKVVTTVAKLFSALDCMVVRFNFRGVGQSQGEFDHGNGESEDLAAIRTWLFDHYNFQRFVLAGFSFGSYVSYRVAAQFPPDVLVSIAPPVENFDFNPIAPPSCPWIVLQGDQDEVVSAELVYEWISTLTTPPTLIKFSSTGHFFHGHLIELRQRLQDAIKQYLD